MRVKKINTSPEISNDTRREPWHHNAKKSTNKIITKNAFAIARIILRKITQLKPQFVIKRSFLKQ